MMSIDLQHTFDFNRHVHYFYEGWKLKKKSECQHFFTHFLKKLTLSKFDVILLPTLKGLKLSNTPTRRKINLKPFSLNFVITIN